MKRGRMYGICALILVGGVAVNCAFAEKQEQAQRKQQGQAQRKQMERKRTEARTEARQERKGNEAVQAFQAEQRARREAHFQRQQEANEAFRATIKDKSPAEKCAAIKQHRTAQHSKNMAFHNEQHQKRLAFTSARLGEQEAPKDKQNEIISGINERHQAVSERMQQRHEEKMALLDQLSAKSDLTHQELHEAMKQFRQTRQKERANFREQHRKSRRESKK